MFFPRLHSCLDDVYDVYDVSGRHAALTPTRIDDDLCRTLGAMNLTRTDIDTKGYESLLSLVENTTNDSFDLYYGLFLYNPNATQVRVVFKGICRGAVAAWPRIDRSHSSGDQLPCILITANKSLTNR